MCYARSAFQRFVLEFHENLSVLSNVQLERLVRLIQIFATTSIQACIMNENRNVFSAELYTKKVPEDLVMIVRIFFLFSSLAIYLVINFRNLLESFIGKNTWQRVWSHILLSFWYWWPIDILHNENIFTSNCWADKNKEHFLKKSFPAFQINFTQIEKALFFYEQ